MFKMIRQFTFHHPKEIIQPTLWLFLSQAFSMVPSVLAFMAVYTLGQAFFPPYTLDLDYLIKLAAAGGVCFLLQYVIELLSYYQTYFRSYRDTADKRIAYIQKLRRQPLGFFSSKESGELISSFATDFANVEYTLCYWLPYPLGVGLLLIISFLWISVFDWRMGIAMFAMIPICLIIMVGISKVKEKHSRQIMDAKAKAATQVNEYLHGMKDLKAYHCTGSGFDAMKTAFRKLRDVSLKDEVTAGSLTTVCGMLVRFIVPITVSAGMYRVIGGSMTILNFAAFVILASKLAEPALMVVTSLSALRGMKPSGERLDGVMVTAEPAGSEELARGEDYEFKDVSFHYGKGEDILQDVSFSVPPGGLTALVGPSGSGKSTLLRLMVRFWDYQKGSVHIGGHELVRIQPDSLLSQISMVMQNTYLMRGTIGENLTFGDESITQEQIMAACKKARCHDFIEALPEKYETLVGEGGSTLSGGERQRIALARAFLKDVPILLLDEPTASLDADNEALVQKALDEIAKERTVIMIAHRLKTVRGAGEILVLENGKITQQGIHGELVSQPGLYKTLWDIQSKAQNKQFKITEV